MFQSFRVYASLLTALVAFGEVGCLDASSAADAGPLISSLGKPKSALSAFVGTANSGKATAPSTVAAADTSAMPPSTASATAPATTTAIPAEPSSPVDLATASTSAKVAQGSKSTETAGKRASSSTGSKPSTDVANAPTKLDGPTLAEMGLLQTATNRPTKAAKKNDSAPTDGQPKPKAAAAPEHARKVIYASRRTGGLVCPPSARAFCAAALRGTGINFRVTRKGSLVCPAANATACREAFKAWAR
jgi:hypothetical protein